MSRSQATILTNMCLIEDGRGNIVMQIRDPKRYYWSGAALPGGHIEAHEGLVESVIREVKEETGLTIKNPKLVGMKHFYTTDNERYLVFLYRTSDFEGEIHSTEEGEVRWVAGRMCLRWTWLMTCSICYVSLKKTISQNFSIGSDLKMTSSENFGNNMNYLFK